MHAGSPMLVGRFYNAITTILCPYCGAAARCAIGRDDRPREYRCEACGEAVVSPPGRCCVFCTHGTVPCAQGQSDRRLLRLIGLARVHR